MLGIGFWAPKATTVIQIDENCESMSGGELQPCGFVSELTTFWKCRKGWLCNQQSADSISSATHFSSIPTFPLSTSLKAQTRVLSRSSLTSGSTPRYLPTPRLNFLLTYPGWIPKQKLKLPINDSSRKYLFQQK